MRLNQFLARNLGISRRQGDELISKQKVKVNQVLGQLFTQVLESDRVEVETAGTWKSLAITKKIQTILFYKPIFCVTTRSDPDGRKTIYDHLPKVYHELKPAGRLDYMSEGLLLLSNDGDLLQSLTHPKFGSKKKYLVGLNTCFEESQIEQMQAGIRIDEYDLNPVRVWQDPERISNLAYLKLDPNTNWYFFELSEGRNQQIRKMCQQFEKKVRRLIRIQQGNYQVSAELYQNKILTVS